MNRIIVFLLLLTTLSLPAALYAYDEQDKTASQGNIVEIDEGYEDTNFKNNYNAIYQFFNDHEYLFTPLAGSIAGWRICGLWCVAVGGAIGVIDEILIYSDWTNRRYFTWGIFGVAAGHAIVPSCPSNAEVIEYVINALRKSDIAGDEVINYTNNVLCKSDTANGKMIKHTIDVLRGSNVADGEVIEHIIDALRKLDAASGKMIDHTIRALRKSDAAIYVIAALLPAERLNNYIGYSKFIVAPIISAISGNYIAGVPGAIAGGATGVFDEVLLFQSVVDKHYLTFIFLGKATTDLSLSGFNPKISNILGPILGLVAANYEKKISADLLSPISSAKSLYTTYSKFISPEQLNPHIERHMVALVGVQFLTQFLSSKINHFYSDTTSIFEHLGDSNSQAWNNLNSQVIYFAIFIVPYVVGQTLTNSIDDYFGKKLHFVLEDEIKSKLFTGETALKLSHDKNATVLMDNLDSDIVTIIYSGGNLMTDAISTTTNGAYGIGIIMATSPNLVIYFAIYDKASSFVSEYLVGQRRNYYEKIRELNSKLISTFKHDAENIRTITERGGVDYTRHKIQQIYCELREYEGSQKLWGVANNIWWSTSGTANFMFIYYLLGREIVNSMFPFEKKSDVQTASWQVSEILAWPGRHAQDMTYITQSLDRITALDDKIHTPSNTTDQIVRETRGGDHLILQDIEVGVEDRMLVAVENLELELGKAYAITGETGCGKSSLLSKINNVRENGVYGKGSIYYPLVNGGDHKIVMISQQDYFPLDSSLEEIISYPDKPTDDADLRAEERKQIKSLLKEIGFYAFSAVDIEGEENEEKDDGDNEIEKEHATEKRKSNILNLDSKKDWYTYLSGGEKRKVMIVSVIIKNPDILILDEIFNGLDSKSIRGIQKMLKKYLPNALILVVDHHARSNNYDFFYDQELRFYDQKIISQRIAVVEDFDGELEKSE